MSRRAIRNMNTYYPDATPEELEAADNVCIICRYVTQSKNFNVCVEKAKSFATNVNDNDAERKWYRRVKSSRAIIYFTRLA